MLVRAIYTAKSTIKTSKVRTMGGLFSSSATPSTTTSSIQERVDTEIGQGATLFTTSSCPFCVRAIALMKETGATYKEIQLDRDSEGSAIRAELKVRTGKTSVPSIWIGGEWVGGLNDGGIGGLATMKAQGKLDSMLKNAGALQ
eukprot:351578_1